MKLGLWIDLVAAGFGLYSAYLWWRASKIEPESGYDADTRTGFAAIGELNAKAAIYTGVTVLAMAVKSALTALGVIC